MFVGMLYRLLIVWLRVFVVGYWLLVGIVVNSVVIGAAHFTLSSRLRFVAFGVAVKDYWWACLRLLVDCVVVWLCCWFCGLCLL